MTARNETQLTRQIERAISKRFPNAWQLKVHGGGYQRGGIPDLLVVINGYLVGLEVKHQKPGESEERLLKRVRTLQHVEIAALRRAGAVAEVVWNVEQAMAILEQVDTLPE